MIFSLIVYLILAIIIRACYDYQIEKTKKEDCAIIDKKVIENMLCERAILSVMLPFFVAAIAFGISTTNLKHDWEKQSETYIYSIYTDRDVEGHFVLGCGSIDTVPYYYYYEDGEVGLKLSKLKAEKVEILETDSETTVPAIVKYVMVNHNSDWFFGVGKTVPCAKTRTIIVLPKGSIQRQVDIKW